MFTAAVAPAAVTEAADDVGDEARRILLLCCEATKKGPMNNRKARQSSTTTSSLVSSFDLVCSNQDTIAIAIVSCCCAALAAPAPTLPSAAAPYILLLLPGFSVAACCFAVCDPWISELSTTKQQQRARDGVVSLLLPHSRSTTAAATGPGFIRREGRHLFTLQRTTTPKNRRKKAPLLHACASCGWRTAAAAPAGAGGGGGGGRRARSRGRRTSSANLLPPRFRRQVRSPLDEANAEVRDDAGNHNVEDHDPSAEQGGGGGGGREVRQWGVGVATKQEQRAPKERKGASSG